VTRLTISRIWKVLMKQLGGSFLPSTSPIGTILSLTFSFRHKVKAQFNSQINRDINFKKGKETNKPASISVSLLLILAKSPKEVVKILKYFKKNLDNKGKNCTPKHHLLILILSGKSLKSRKCFPIFRTRKLRIFRKLSAVKASLN